MPAVTIPGVGRVNFPDGMPLPDIEAQAQRLAGNVGRDSQGQVNPDLALLDQQMTDTVPGARRLSEAPTFATLPFGVDVPLPGVLGKAFNAAGSFLDNNMTPAVVGATIGSIAVPPLGVGAGLPFLARMAAQFGPTIGAAGLGGGAGGALEAAQQPNATPSSIASAGLSSGAQMAGAEALGIPVGAVASRVLNPNLRFLDPLKPVRDDIIAAASALPEQFRSGVSRVMEALPSGPVRDTAEAAARTIGTVNTTVRHFLRPEADGVSVREVIDNVADALDLTPGHGAELLDVVARNPGAIGALKSSLSAEQLENFRTAVLGRAIQAGTVKRNGYLMLDGGQFRAAWNPVRQAFSPVQRYTGDALGALSSTLQRIGRFASNSTVRTVADRASTVAVDAAFGLHVGLPFAIGKAVLRPGPLQTYLTRPHAVPTELLPQLGRQVAALPGRLGLSASGDEQP